MSSWILSFLCLSAYLDQTIFLAFYGTSPCLKWMSRRNVILVCIARLSNRLVRLNYTGCLCLIDRFILSKLLCHLFKLSFSSMNN
jgi:hypothetical protein